MIRTVILASEDLQMSRIFAHKGIGTMPTDIVVGTYLAFSVLDQEEGEASFSDLDIVSIVDEPRLMGDDEPLLGEDCSSLKLVQGFGSVP